MREIIDRSWSLTLVIVVGVVSILLDKMGAPIVLIGEIGALLGMFATASYIFWEMGR